MTRIRKAPAPHPEDIKAAVRKKEGKSLSALAREANLSESSLHKALKVPCPAGEKVISAYLGRPLHELWPERWTVDGQQVRPRWRHKYFLNSEPAAA